MSEKQEVINQITAIDKGPMALKLYMEICARCGTCASVCPIYFGEPSAKYNPVLRSDLIR